MRTHLSWKTRSRLSIWKDNVKMELKYVCMIFSSYSIWVPISDLLNRRDEIKNDLKQLNLRNWIQLVKDSKAWNDLAQMTEINVGLQSQKKVKKKMDDISLLQWPHDLRRGSAAARLL